MPMQITDQYLSLSDIVDKMPEAEHVQRIYVIGKSLGAATLIQLAERTGLSKTQTLQILQQLRRLGKCTSEQRKGMTDFIMK